MSLDNSCCTPEEKKYNKKLDTTKNGTACLRSGDCAMVNRPNCGNEREKNSSASCQGLQLECRSTWAFGRHARPSHARRI
jgi:hypothetical protein